MREKRYIENFIDFFTPKSYVLNKIKNNDYDMEKLPIKFKSDKDIFMEAIKYDVDNLKYASDKLKDDKEFILNSLKNNEAFIQSGGEEFDGEPIDYHHVVILNNVSDRLKNDKDVIMEAVKSDCENIKFISENLKNDKDFMLEILNNTKEWYVEQNIRYFFDSERKPPLAYLSDKLKDDKEIVIECVKKDIDNLKYSSDRLKNDNDFIIKVLTINKDSENFLKENLKDNKNKDVLLSRDNISFFELTKEQKTDKELALKVVTNNGHQLKHYLSQEIINNKEIVMTAIKDYSGALKWASNKLKDDKEVVLEAIKNNGCTLKYASDRLKDDKDVVMTAIKQNYSALEYASPRLQNDKDIVMEIENEKSIEKYIENYWKEYNSNKETVKDNQLEKSASSEKSNNPWEAKVSNDKDNQWER